MKNLLLATMAAAAIAAPAQAADLPVKAPRGVVETVYSWAGLYIGINGGAVWTRKCWDYIGTAAAPQPAVSEGCHNGSGGTVGGQIGYLWQRDRFVFGAEAQGNWADFRSQNVSVAFPAFVNRTRVGPFGIFTGRLGYAWNTAMVYVKGGGAVVSDHFDYTTTAGALVGDAGRLTRWGWAAGGGAEMALGSNWSAGLDYTFARVEHRGVQFVSPTSTRDDINQDIHVFTARLNWRFGGPVARY
jgi:outer membrane immunogenic protein